jgi:sigma-B regulation protein RsbU (phosphoserine phosphatase)
MNSPTKRPSAPNWRRYFTWIELANGGCPFPFLFRAARNEVEEVELASYPLGAIPNSVFPAQGIDLEPGDRVVFCSDGLVESQNVERDFFGYERVQEIIRQGCIEDLPSKQLVDRLLGKVRDFAGDVPQQDDQTVVVVKIL